MENTDLGCGDVMGGMFCRDNRYEDCLVLKLPFSECFPQGAHGLSSVLSFSV